MRERQPRGMAPKLLLDKVRALLSKHPDAKTALFNVNWIVFDKFVMALLGLVVGVWVARYLGPEKFGVIAYVMAISALLSPLALLGLNSVVVRSIVTKPQDTDLVLGTAFLLKLVGSLLLVVASVLLVDSLSSNGSSPKGDDSLVLYMLILGVGTLFRTFDVIVYYFQSQVKAKYFSISDIASNVVCSVARVGLILGQAALLPFIIVASFNNVLLIGILFIFFQWKSAHSIIKWRFSWTIAWNLMKDAWPLALSLASALIYLKIDQIMIGDMLGKRDLGIYSAAVRLTEAWNFVPAAIMESIFPAIIRLRAKDKATYLRRVQSVSDAFVWTTIVIGVLFSFCSEEVVWILYGDKYVGSGFVLAVYIWSAVFVFLNTVSGYCLIAENYMMIGLFRTCTGALLNVALNLWLIPRQGIAGAAYATLVAYFWTSTVSLFLFRKTRVYALMQIKSVNLFRILGQLKRAIV